MTYSPLPRLTSVPSRLAARIKVLPEDFEVEEVPAYAPSGAGEHLYLFLEKRDVPAEQLLRHIGRSLGIPTGEIGCAGLKDRRAVTRQWISVPAKLADRISTIETEQIRVLEQRLHGNKLRTGHLQGNRFRILVRPRTGSESVAAASLTLQPLQSAVEQIQRQGFANYYGDQRFGRQGETLQLGLDLLTGRQTPKSIPYSRRRFLLKLAVSAVQSDLFNQVLADRIRQGCATTVLSGDVMEVAASGGKFVVEDVAAEQVRCDSGETAITGPLFGPKMKAPQADAAALENRVLQAAELTVENFTGFGDLLSGTRRRLLIRPQDLTVTEEPDGLRFQFTLPAGVYATTLLDEIFELQDGPVTAAAEPDAASEESE